MSDGGFRFAQGNLAKLIALPQYVLGFVLAWFVPRRADHWVFGSGAGVGEGALALARALRASQPDAAITWLAADDAESEAARRAGFEPVLRNSWAGFMATLRAAVVVVTHGLGDANRFGSHRAFIVQLWHGAPLKRLHLDSPVTTQLQGPTFLRGLLRRMYSVGARQVDLYVAGSPTSAERLRSAFRVAPGKVQVLGDPRDDALALAAARPDSEARSRAALLELLNQNIRGIDGIVSTETFLYLQLTKQRYDWGTR